MSPTPFSECPLSPVDREMDERDWVEGKGEREREIETQEDMRESGDRETVTEGGRSDGKDTTEKGEQGDD